MKQILAAADNAIEIADIEDVQVEISKTAQWLQDMMPRLIDFVLQVAFAFVVIIVGVKLIGWVRKILRRTLQRRDADTGLIQFLDAFVKYVLYLILAMSVLQNFGVQTTSIVAAIGSAGVAVGLALQGSLSNIAGGVLILFLKPFKVGDYIIQGDMEGTVSEIALFYTTLATPDNRKIFIPNGQLANDSLINVTGANTRRLDIKVGISYGSDIRAAKEILWNLAQNDPDVLLTEETKLPMTAVSELGDSSVGILLRVWTPTDKYWDVKFRLTEAVKVSFDEAGIEIPFNQLDVRVIQS